MRRIMCQTWEEPESLCETFVCAENNFNFIDIMQQFLVKQWQKVKYEH